MAEPTEGPTWLVASDPVACAARCLVERLDAIAATAPTDAEEIRLAIPGGSALAVALRAVALLGERWRRVALTWVDERCVPVDDPESNRGEAMRQGLLRLAPARIVPLFEDGESPEAAIARHARRWQAELRDGLDVALLGLGEDGHVASLFPARPWPRDGIAFHVADAPKPPASRISLTRAALARARHTILFATGEAKRPALARLQAGDASLPATGLPGLVVVTDRR
ncbi:MAG: 6-phosphogluconolactonase [Myxococcota bacterium]